MTNFHSARTVTPPIETRAYTDVNGTVHETYVKASEANAREALRRLYHANSAHEEMTFQGLLEMIQENRELMMDIVNYLGKVKQ